VPDKYKWNLADMYKSISDWHADIKKVELKINEFTSYKGKLSKNSKTLLDALNTYFEMLKTFYKASTYAENLSNEDVNISENQALTQKLSAVGTKFGEASAFLQPEILSIPKEKIDKFLKEQPQLEQYSIFIDNIQRLRSHTLSEAEEKYLQVSV